jgi:hypothetical protein
VNVRPVDRGVVDDDAAENNCGEKENGQSTSTRNCSIDVYIITFSEEGQVNGPRRDILGNNTGGNLCEGAELTEVLGSARSVAGSILYCRLR